MEHFPTGVTFKCFQCSGSIQECNSMSAKNVTCETGQDRCLKKMMSKDGKESGIYGCASSLDCRAAEASCTAVGEDNARATCTYECCNTTSCNRPLAKSMVLLLDLISKLNFIVVNPT